MSRPNRLLGAPTRKSFANSDPGATAPGDRVDPSADRAGRGKPQKDPHAHPTFNRYWYRLNSRYFSNDDTVFMNWGYEEDPPMGLQLAESDEPHRYSIQLYHRTATQVDLTGKKVLEVSCGHGGGASYPGPRKS